MALLLPASAVAGIALYATLTVLAVVLVVRQAAEVVRDANPRSAHGERP